jgi:Skp family chaperone for outer membrane proteins
MRRIPIVLALVFLASLPIAAQTQQVTKVGICDFTKVLSTAYKDTKAFRDLDQAKTDITKAVAERMKDISDLQNQKLEADKAGNKTLAATLEKAIADKQSDLDSYRRVKNAWLTTQTNALLTGPVLKEIFEQMTLVAESGGYALVLRSDGAYRDIILYRIPEVDITDDVIAAIFAKQGKTYNPAGGQ